MQLSKLGPLNAVVIEPDPSTAVPPLTIVLLHGYGAPGTDLVGLGPQLASALNARLVFPWAPLELEPGAGPHGGRAWWPIDMVKLQVGMMTGQLDVLSKETPSGLSEARDALKATVDAILALEGVAPERLVLGGFSQGAMLSCDFALRSELPLAGLIQLSGTVLCADEWKGLLPAREGLPVFQSHSPEDMVLPFTMAERLANWMREAKLAHEFVSFRGGHGIGPEVLEGLKSFLKRLT